MRKISSFALAAVLACSVLPETAAAQGTDINRAGTVPYPAANTGFPERIGRFRRISATRFDDDGRDIGAGYALDGTSLVVSVYIYLPPPQQRRATPQATCSAVFTAAADAIRNRASSVHNLPDNRALTVPGVSPALSHRAAFEHMFTFQGESQRVRTEVDLYCDVGGPWLVKYYASGPVDLNARAEIDAFIRSSAWPGRRF